MKYSLSIILIYILSIFLLLSCGPVNRVDTTAMKEKMSEFEIKRVTPAQINAQVEDLGEKMAKALTPVVDKEMQTASAERKVEICHLKNVQLIDSLSRVYGLKVRLLGTLDVQNKSLYAKEQEVMDAYVYNAEKKLPLSNNVQQIGDSLFVYTAPIPADNSLCRICFSNDANHLAVWSIVFRKSEIIRKIDVKKLK